MVFGAKLRVRIDHEVSELQRDKKLIEYSTHASVDKFCFQYRIENVRPRCSKRPHLGYVAKLNRS